MIGSDIETGPLPEEILREMYTPPTLEEFAESCDKRWKPETVKAKHEESLTSGWEKFRDKAALSPVTGELLAVGYFSVDGNGKFALIDDNEDAMLEEFWAKLDKFRDRPLVGHNFRGFDIPFLVGRSWINEIDVPPWVIERGRFVSEKCCFDTMEAWSAVTGDRFTKLGQLARIFGVGEKTGEEEVTGANFHEWWKGSKEQKAKAIEYLKKDVVLVTQVAARMGVI